MHFMFGPNADQNLKVITSEVKSKIWTTMLDNSKKKWIQIIESSIGEHDRNVAITQWLTHFLILVSWILIKENKLLEKWNAPIGTINDMVNLNPFSIKEINEFLDTLSIWKDVFKSYLEFVTDKLDEKQRDNFWTPRFWEVFNFCRENKLILNEENLKKIMELEQNNFLEVITDIRENNWKIRLFA
jgi:hypothetical protein